MNTPYMLSPDELHKLQRVLLEMLLELDRVCKKHSIRYCLIAGTLLGAVRHGGFIPWDDDLDVGMTRGEYEKFRAVSHELDPARFFFQDHTTDPGYRWGWGRVRRLNSEFLRTGQEHMSMRTGIFLDVFPLDGVPDCYPLRALRNFECFVVRKFLYAETGTVTGRGISRLLYRLMLNIPRDTIFRWHDRLIARGRGKAAKYVRILTFPTPKNRKFGYLLRWYTDLDDISFEGYRFPAPKDRDGYLRFKFGDYTTPPPEGARRTHPVSAFKLPDDCALYD